MKGTQYVERQYIIECNEEEAKWLHNISQNFMPQVGMQVEPIRDGEIRKGFFKVTTPEMGD